MTTARTLFSAASVRLWREMDSDDPETLVGRCTRSTTPPRPPPARSLAVGDEEEA
jgi:hypothetical protein